GQTRPDPGRGPRPDRRLACDRVRDERTGGAGRAAHAHDRSADRERQARLRRRRSGPEPKRRTGGRLMPKQADFGALLNTAQQRQADMAKAQEELKNESVEATVGGGMVSVKMTGDLELQEIKIDPEAVDPEDVDMLQDMVLAAVNEAIRAAQELATSKMNQAA